MKRILVVVLSLGLCACGPAHKSASAAKEQSTSEKASAPHGPATITADPNPVPAGGELGETTIAWDTGSDETGEVYVTKNGGPEKLFASSASGSHVVPWISKKTRFQFLLYEGTDHKKLLAKVQVTHAG
ncbi:MAG: hypothetical protein ABI946_10480 [Chthoniobacterales bacterium]